MVKSHKRFWLLAASVLLGVSLLLTFLTSSIRGADPPSAEKGRNISSILLLLFDEAALAAPEASISVRVLGISMGGWDYRSNVLVKTGSDMKLHGDRSTDPGGAPLTYRWSMTSKPTGSGAILSHSNADEPTFTADVDGTYEISLVVNNGTEDSEPAKVTITASMGNHAPLPGPPFDLFNKDRRDNHVIYYETTEPIGDRLSVEAWYWWDPDGDDIESCDWSLVSQPEGSNPQWAQLHRIVSELVADVEGKYVIRVVCSDGVLDSEPVFITITAKKIQRPPKARAGADKTVETGSLVELDGSGSSDADGDPLTYKWTMTSKPTASTATLSGSTTKKPTFTPDVDGTYKISLVVNDGTEDSAPDTVTITASEDIVVDLAKVVVGAWAGGAICSGKQYEFGWFLCPGGRLRGYEKMAGVDFVVCGTWTLEDDELVIKYTATGQGGNEFPGQEERFNYYSYQDPSDDFLAWQRCLLFLDRLEGGPTTADDCTQGTCTKGGTGDVQCGTDADCGRCFYCDGGKCRYAGEGPYGCYGGWTPPE